MVKILTATEAILIDEALDEAYKQLEDYGADELEFILEARFVLKKLKEKTIEEVLGEDTTS